MPAAAFEADTGEPGGSDDSRGDNGEANSDERCARGAVGADTAGGAAWSAVCAAAPSAG